MDRRQLSSKIIQILDRKNVIKGYTIVYGALGVGKSTIVDSVIQGRPGVIKIRVSSNTSRTDIISRLSEITGTKDIKATIDGYKEAMEMGLSYGGTIPTIDFEI